MLCAVRETRAVTHTDRSPTQRKWAAAGVEETVQTDRSEACRRGVTKRKHNISVVVLCPEH